MTQTLLVERRQAIATHADELRAVAAAEQRIGDPLVHDLFDTLAAALLVLGEATGPRESQAVTDPEAR